MFRKLIVVAAATAVIGASGSAAASEPTVAQINAAIAAHSDNFVLANSYAYNGRPPGHGWIDLTTGAGRWLSPNGNVVMLQTVTPVRRDPNQVIVSDTTIDYVARTWSRTSREESTKMARPVIVDPLADSSQGFPFRLLGVQDVDGRQAYHLRSTYAAPSGRVDVWFSTVQAYLIRITRTSKDGTVVGRVDNRWLPRTRANLALLKATIPSGFKQVSVSP